ncbi:MAG TPA: peptidoglycan bridge formation glycyltransferase FemA/FemB family protein [Candidatus Saccharimonadales bacterium]|nr:peptidoglycan bridge formation glycyltransferase FemA/FemB family protein [Candidatus Saccharimonadales bacterium]
MLHIQPVEEKIIWEKFLFENAPVFYPLFQSWNWGEVQKSLGFEVIRLGLFENKSLVGVCQIVDVNARRGHYLHLRHGPILSPFDSKHFAFFIDHIKRLALSKNASFIRMSALVEEKFVDHTMLSKMGFRNAPIHRMDAEVCWVLDITKPEDEILANMRKSHRYLIRRGLTDKNLKITQTKHLTEIEKFLPLYESLSQRKHFVPHRGVREEFRVFGAENQEVLFFAEFEKKIIAAALIAFAGNTAIYRHSASDDNYRNIPAMYLIQWHAIQEAKKRGVKLYNFWGIAPDVSSRHPWSGLTLFKTGFGGEKKEFLRAQDLPLSLNYWKTYAIDSIFKKLKGY